MSERRTGWLFVAVQAALLGALVLLPSGDAWPRPGWLRLGATAILVTGLALVAVAALRLGPGLTATPVPRGGGQLVTTGLFRFVRHPIYTGLLLVVAAIAIRSGSVVTLAVALVTVAFFRVKSGWEEDRLRERYPDYGRYAARTGRFLPRPTWRRSR